MGYSFRKCPINNALEDGPQGSGRLSFGYDEIVPSIEFYQIGRATVSSQLDVCRSCASNGNHVVSSTVNDESPHTCGKKLVQ